MATSTTDGAVGRVVFELVDWQKVERDGGNAGDVGVVVVTLRHFRLGAERHLVVIVG